MEIRNVDKFICKFGYKRESGISKTRRLLEAPLEYNRKLGAMLVGL